MLLAFALLVFGGGTPGTFAAAPGTIAADRAASFRPRIVLATRIESARPPGARHLREVADEVRAIWASHADVHVEWPGDLTRPGLDDRLQLVLTDRYPRTGSPDALGWIEFTAPDRPGRIIHASVAAARQLATRRGSPLRSGAAVPEVVDRFVARALGRSIAHELGHYLLCTTAHSRRGLMRARFTPADILDTGRSHVRIDPSHNARLAERLEQYAQAALDWMSGAAIDDSRQPPRHD